MYDQANMSKPGSFALVLAVICLVSLQADAQPTTDETNLDETTASFGERMAKKLTDIPLPPAEPTWTKQALVSALVDGLVSVHSTHIHTSKHVRM